MGQADVIRRARESLEATRAKAIQLEAERAYLESQILRARAVISELEQILGESPAEQPAAARRKKATKEDTARRIGALREIMEARLAEIQIGDLTDALRAKLPGEELDQRLVGDLVRRTRTVFEQTRKGYWRLVDQGGAA